MPRPSAPPTPAPRRRLVSALCAASLALAAACSEGEEPVLDGESSVVVAQRGAGFTDEKRAEDAAAGVPTAAPTAEVPPPDEAADDGAAPAPGDPTLVVGSVDASRAAALKADPSAHAKTAIEGLVTFRMLSLEGIDIDSLLDYLFTPESERARAFEFPASVKALDGKDCALVGYMIPLEFKPKTDDIKIFMLVRDLMSCCFGGAPRPDEWVYVEMEGERASKLYPYVPIVVRGTLSVGRLEDEFGLSSGVYSMKARSVDEFKAE